MTGGHAPRNAGWWCLLVALCLVLLAPLTLADVPPLLDYPNHLARLYVLAFVGTDPVLARFYQPHWRIIPNLALDLTVPPLLRVLPVAVVGRAMVGVTLLLPVFGAAAYHRALTGRLSWWPLASVLFVYNGASLRGFLNFVASIGLALLLAAIWLAWRERRPMLSFAIGAVGAVVLFFCHLTGLVFFAVLIGGHEIVSLRKAPIPIAQRGLLVLGVFAMPAILYAMSNLQQMDGEAEFHSVAGKAHAALTPVLNYSWPLDLATAFACVVVVGLCLGRRWCVMPLQAGLALVALLLLFVGLPAGFKGTYDLDMRFIVMAAFLLPAALVPVALPRRANRALGLGFLLLFTTRMAVLFTVWHGQAAYLTAFRYVIDSVQPGDVVLTTGPPSTEATPVWTSAVTARTLSDGTVVDFHLSALLLIEHRAWWPFLFDNPSQQPLEGREPFQALAELIDHSSDPIALLADDDSLTRLVTHVLVRGRLPDSAEVAGLKLIAQSGDIALYAVRRDQISRTPPASPPPGH